MHMPRDGARLIGDGDLRCFQQGSKQWHRCLRSQSVMVHGQGPKLRNLIENSCQLSGLRKLGHGRRPANEELSVRVALVPGTVFKQCDLCQDPASRKAFAPCGTKGSQNLKQR